MLTMCVCVCVCVCVRARVLSCLVVSDSVNPLTVASQAPLSMEFSRQEYWSQLPIPTPGDLSDSGIESASLVPPALAGRLFITIPPGKPSIYTSPCYELIMFLSTLHLLIHLVFAITQYYYYSQVTDEEIETEKD